MINCYKFKQKISDYIDGRIPFRERQEFEDHKTGCTQCSQVFENVIKVRQAMTGLKPVKTSDDFMSTLSRKILADRNSRILASQKKGFSFRRLPAFSYAFGSALTAVVVGFIIIQTQKYDDVTIPVMPLAEQQAPAVVAPARSIVPQQQIQPPQYLANQSTAPVTVDTAGRTEKQQEAELPFTIDYSKQIQTVGDRR